MQNASEKALCRRCCSPYAQLHIHAIVQCCLGMCACDSQPENAAECLDYPPENATEYLVVFLACRATCPVVLVLLALLVLVVLVVLAPGGAGAAGGAGAGGAGAGGAGAAGRFGQQNMRYHG